MSLTEDPRALARELEGLSLTRVETFVNVARARLPAQIRNQLPQSGLGARRQISGDLDAFEALAPAEAAEARRIWLETARSELLSPGDVARLREATAAALAPGHDPTLGDNFVPERAKVDLRDDMVAIDWLEGARLAAMAVGYVEVPRYFGGARSNASGGTAFLIDSQHVLTAYHVVTARDRAREAPPAEADLARQLAASTVAFDYVRAAEVGEDRGTPVPVHSLVASDMALDFAVLRLVTPMPIAPVTLWNGALPAVDKQLGF